MTYLSCLVTIACAACCAKLLTPIPATTFAFLLKELLQLQKSASMPCCRWMQYERDGRVCSKCDLHFLPLGIYSNALPMAILLPPSRGAVPYLSMAGLKSCCSCRLISLCALILTHLPFATSSAWAALAATSLAASSTSCPKARRKSLTGRACRSGSQAFADTDAGATHMLMPTPVHVLILVPALLLVLLLMRVHALKGIQLLAAVSPSMALYIAAWTSTHGA